MEYGIIGICKVMEAVMYLKQSKYANGEIFLSIMEKFRDKDGKVRERTYKSIGYLKDLEKQYEDPEKGRHRRSSLVVAEIILRQRPVI